MALELVPLGQDDVRHPEIRIQFKCPGEERRDLIVTPRMETKFSAKFPLGAPSPHGAAALAWNIIPQAVSDVPGSQCTATRVLRGMVLRMRNIKGITPRQIIPISQKLSTKESMEACRCIP